MTRALFWKEWREQRAVILTGVLVTAVMPFFLLAGASMRPRGLPLKDLSEILPGFYGILLWPLIAAAAGAGTIAGEIGEGTLGFLLSRPVSRLRVWTVKVLVGAGAAATVAMGSLLVAWSLTLVAGPTSRSTLPSLSVGSEMSLGWLSIVGSSFLIFSASVFFSTVVSRAMTAAAAGLTAALILLGGLTMLWSRIDLMPRLEPGWISLEVGIAGVLILLASLALFSRGEMLRGSGARKAAVLAGLLAVAGIGLVTAPVAFSMMRLTPEKAVLNDPTLSPARDAVVATATNAEGGSPQVWMIPTDGSGMTRLTGRLTWMAKWSPDGEWLAYVSARGPLGLRADGLEVRVVRADGLEDHAVTDRLDRLHRGPLESGALHFSPDSGRIAFLFAGNLRVVDRRGLGEESFRVGPLVNPWILGWTQDGSGVLLLDPAWQGERPARLAVHHLQAGGLRILVEEEDRLWLPWWESPQFTTVLPLVASGREEGVGGHRLLLVDLDDGSIETVVENRCSQSARLSDDGRFLAYARCLGKGGTDLRTELFVREVATGEERAFATPAGSVAGLHPSPRGNRVAVRQALGGSTRTVIVDEEGHEVALDSDWMALGWSGRDALVVVDGYEGRRLAVADARDGSLRPLYP